MHLSYMHRRMSGQKPQEIQHAIGNDREPNRRPRRLANKIGEDSVPCRPAIFSQIFLKKSR